MGAASRAKGVTGEREVAALWEKHGFSVRGLEGEGDHLIIGHGHVIFQEVKRRERVDVPGGLRQVEAECPHGADPVFTHRRNRSRWYSTVPTEWLVALLARETP